MTTFERSTDYALIRSILTEPRCFRRMTARLALEADALEIGPLEGIEYIVVFEEIPKLNAEGNRLVSQPVAVFLIVQGCEIHFCFVPAAWGRTVPIARAFLVWVWENTNAKKLLGPVPIHNRLALRLACAVGFTEYATRGGHVLTEIRKYGT